MKTSIFDMSFTLPPMIEMVKEEKEMPMGTFLAISYVFNKSKSCYC